nr:ABC transporter substrate-binding protein [Roseovarius sp. Pro17]
MVYNNEEIKKPPTSWENLWNPDYAGRGIMPSAVTSIRVPVLAMFNSLAGGTLDDLARAAEKMADCRLPMPSQGRRDGVGYSVTYREKHR